MKETPMELQIGFVGRDVTTLWVAGNGYIDQLLINMRKGYNESL